MKQVFRDALLSCVVNEFRNGSVVIDSTTKFDVNGLRSLADSAGNLEAIIQDKIEHSNATFFQGANVSAKQLADADTPSNKPQLPSRNNPNRQHRNTRQGQVSRNDRRANGRSDHGARSNRHHGPVSKNHHGELRRNISESTQSYGGDNMPPGKHDRRTLFSINIVLTSRLAPSGQDRLCKIYVEVDAVPKYYKSLLLPYVIRNMVDKIDKESLSIIVGLKNFHRYLWDRMFAGSPAVAVFAYSVLGANTGCIRIQDYPQAGSKHPTSCSTLAMTISKLRQSFSTHGIPDVIVSDNATGFVNDEFHDFC
ncbi:hypothetical protein LSAT2_001156 [Lamellibrachia satsuma]|nr:hypothetical protein LSAT2_001156 [Lamellibrachia satsuma]